MNHPDPPAAAPGPTPGRPGRPTPGPRAGTRHDPRSPSPVSLEDRLSAAAAAVRASVGPVPAGPAPHSAPRGVRTSVLVLVAVLAAGALILPRAMSAIGGGGGEGEDRTQIGPATSGGRAVSPAELPFYVLGVDGMGPSVIYDDTEGHPMPLLYTPGDYVLYGEGGADDPFAGSDLLVSTRPAAGPVPTGAPRDEDTVEVRGHQAKAGVVEQPANHAGMTYIEWDEPPLGHVKVASYTLDRATLQAVADALRVDHGVMTYRGEAATAAQDLGDLREVGRRHIPDLSHEAESQYRYVGYPVPGGVQGGTVGLWVDRGTAREVPVVRWEQGLGRTVEVRGHEGWVSSAGDGMSRLMWQEASGVIVGLEGHASESDLLAWALTVRTVSQSRWDEMKAATPY